MSGKNEKIPMSVDLGTFKTNFRTSSQWVPFTEKRGCGYRVKKDRIYVQVQAQRHSSSTRVLSNRPYILRIKGWPRILERFSPWFHGVWRTTGPILWHTSTGGYMKVHICSDTCELWYTPIKNTTLHRQNHCFWFLTLLRGTPFWHMLKHMTEFLVLETRMFLHYPPKTCGTNTFWFNSWLPCSFYNPTFTFPPVSPVYSSQSVRRKEFKLVRGVHSILLHKIQILG